MSNCLNCNEILPETEGVKPKKYCSNKCKQAYWQKNKPKSELPPDPKLEALKRENAWLKKRLEELGQNKTITAPPDEKQDNATEPVKKIKKKSEIEVIVGNMKENGMVNENGGLIVSEVKKKNPFDGLDMTDAVLPSKIRGKK